MTNSLSLYLIRHAQADTRGPHYPDDSLRPLINKGHTQAKALAKTFARLAVRFDRLYTSPYTRALETAEPLASRLRQTHSLEPLEALTADDYPALLKELAARLEPADRMIALVGHEPYLSELTSYLLSGDARRVAFRFRKAAFIALDGPLAEGAMTLSMMVPAKVYRRM